MATRRWYKVAGVLLVAATLLCSTVNATASYGRLDSSPNCVAWPGGLFFYASPTFAQDQTLFVTLVLVEAAGARHVLLRSTDGGRSWTETPRPTDPRPWWDDLHFSPYYALDLTLYADYGGEGYLARSTDSAHTWSTLIAPRTTASSWASLAMQDARTLFMALGTMQPGGSQEKGLFYTADAGGSWEQRLHGGIDAVALSPNFAQDHTMLVSPDAYKVAGGVWRSTDAGLTWQDSSEGLVYGGTTDTTQTLVFSPAYTEDQTLFYGNWTGLYKSTDTGAHWSRIDAMAHAARGGTPYFILSPRYAQDQTIWSYVAAGWLRSTDGGTTWRALPSKDVTPLAVRETCRPSGECQVELFGELFVRDDIPPDYSRRTYLLTSFDGGDTWRCLESPDVPLPTPTVPPVTPTPPPPAEIPEPATGWLLVSGLAGVAGYLWRRAARR